MQHCLVVLDNSAAAWQTAYMAYDVAARSGSKLMGVVVERDQEDAAARRKFEAGARAAGIRVTVRSVPALSAETLRPLFAWAQAVFVSRDSLKSPDALESLVHELHCPLWIVPQQRTIRRVMVATTSGAATAPEMGLGLSLMKRWSILLEILVSNDSVQRMNQAQTLSDDISQRVVPQLTLSAFLKRADDDDIDLAVVAWPNDAIPLWEASSRAHCLLAVCPTLNSH